MDLEDNYLSLHRTRLLRHGDAQLAFYRLAADDGKQKEPIQDSKFKIQDRGKPGCQIVNLEF